MGVTNDVISDAGIDTLKERLAASQHGMATVECKLLAGVIRRLEIVEGELRAKRDPEAYAMRIAEGILTSDRLALGQQTGPGRISTRGTCSIEGCENLIQARGLCANHYSRSRRYGNPVEPDHRKRRVTVRP